MHHDGAARSGGARKYLTEAERTRFLVEAGRCERKVQASCHTLAWPGCRISEALALTPERVDLDTATLTFASLKKRCPNQFRGVPVPPKLIRTLDYNFGIRGVPGPRCHARRARTAASASRRSPSRGSAPTRKI